MLKDEKRKKIHEKLKTLGNSEKERVRDRKGESMTRKRETE